MKKLAIACILAAAAASMTGCVSVSKNDGGESCLRPNICKECILKKYEVGKEKVAAEETVKCALNFICWGGTASHYADQAEFSGFGAVSKAKNGAYAKACEAAKCDQIVGTRYTITTDDYFFYKKVKAEISGYPAKMTGVEIVPGCCKCGKTAK